LPYTGYAVEISPLQLHCPLYAYTKIEGFTDLVP
jgi:hypothetical protein